MAEATSRPPISIPADLLESLLDEDPCYRDHHGGCQAHGFLSLQPHEGCPVQEAKDLLAAASVLCFLQGDPGLQAGSATVTQRTEDLCASTLMLSRHDLCRLIAEAEARQQLAERELTGMKGAHHAALIEVETLRVLLDGERTRRDMLKADRLHWKAEAERLRAEVAGMREEAGQMQGPYETWHILAGQRPDSAGPGRLTMAGSGPLTEKIDRVAQVRAERPEVGPWRMDRCERWTRRIPEPDPLTALQEYGGYTADDAAKILEDLARPGHAAASINHSNA